tara:strand:+ start:530 stop:1012 length:483 start_codon:yes stop_codon:yes gene_type:complete
MIEIVIAIIILIILIILLKRTKVPKQVYKSKVIYKDHKEKPTKALYSHKYILAGKPDYILHTKDGLVPLEIKHSRRPKQPYKSHIMQLISYCLLIEETRKERPKYGFIQYKGGKAFTIQYTDELKQELLKIMDEMRNYTPKQPIKTYKCGFCNYKDECFG